jgi:hypothetical protein
VRHVVAGEATPRFAAMGWDSSTEPGRCGYERTTGSAPINSRDGRAVVGEAAPCWGHEGTGSSVEFGRDVYRRKDEVRVR